MTPMFFFIYILIGFCSALLLAKYEPQMFRKSFYPALFICFFLWPIVIPGYFVLYWTL